MARAWWKIVERPLEDRTLCNAKERDESEVILPTMFRILCTNNFTRSSHFITAPHLNPSTSRSSVRSSLFFCLCSSAALYSLIFLRMNLSLLRLLRDCPFEPRFLPDVFPLSPRSRFGGSGPAGSM